MIPANNNSHNADRIAVVRFWLLSVPLAVVPASWIIYAVYSIIAVWCGSQPRWSFWLVWLFASGGVSVPIAVAFWCLCYVGSNPVFRFAEAKYTAPSVLAIIAFLLCFGFAGYFAGSSEPSATGEALLVALGILSTIGLELLALGSTSKSLLDFKEALESESDVSRQSKIVKNVCDVMANRDNMTKYLCFSDAPVAFGMISLTIVVGIHEYGHTGANPEHIRAFLAGAIALQLLYSNFIFWLEACADYPRGRRWFERLPPWAASIRQMLDPTRARPNTPTTEWAKSKLCEMFPTVAAVADPQPGNGAKGD